MTEPFSLLLATTNRGKVAELTALFGDVGLHLVSLGSLPGKLAPVIEDGATFLDNALLKARAAAQATGMVTLAEDSGLEVDALGGRPGVRSARFAARARRTPRTTRSSSRPSPRSTTISAPPVSAA